MDTGIRINWNIALRHSVNASYCLITPVQVRNGNKAFVLVLELFQGTQRPCYTRNDQQLSTGEALLTGVEKRLNDALESLGIIIIIRSKSFNIPGNCQSILYTSPGKTFWETENCHLLENDLSENCQLPEWLVQHRGPLKDTWSSSGAKLKSKHNNFLFRRDEIFEDDILIENINYPSFI